MIKYLQTYFAGIPATFIDGFLYLCIAIFQFLQTAFGSDEASKYIDLEVLFYIKTFVGAIAAGLLAVKLYRSTGFADHKRMKQDTQFYSKPPVP